MTVTPGAVKTEEDIMQSRHGIYHLYKTTNLSEVAVGLVLQFRLNKQFD